MKNYINFYNYMKICLYDKKNGYYTNAIKNIGKNGDFITAPEIGSIFTNELSLKIDKALKKLQGGYIIEIGAGTGNLANKILKQCYKLKTPCYGYKIIEISKKLIKMQKHFLMNKEIKYKIEWINKFKKKIKGIIICNEIIDAIPTYAFQINNENISERIITLNNLHYFQWSKIKAKKKLIKYIKYINLQKIQYKSEICLLIYPWIKFISSIIKKGYIFIFDYGYTRKELYNKIRENGTIIGHYKHKAIKNIFINHGKQDITYHIDFTCIYESIKLTNLNYIKYEYISNFLLKNNKKIIKKFKKNKKEVNKLIYPNEMGLIFKLIYFSKNINKII